MLDDRDGDVVDEHQAHLPEPLAPEQRLADIRARRAAAAAVRNALAAARQAGLARRHAQKLRHLAKRRTRDSDSAPDADTERPST